MNVYSSLIHNHSKQEKKQVSSNGEGLANWGGWVGVGVHMYRHEMEYHLLLITQKEQTNDIGSRVCGSRMLSGRSQAPKAMYWRVPGKGKTTGTEGQAVVARNWRSGEELNTKEHKGTGR